MWKFSVPIANVFELEMPEGAIPLSCGVQKGQAVIWAAVDTTTEKKERHLFYLRGTGEDLPNLTATRFMGTFQMLGGDLIYHLFDGGPVRE